MAGDVPPLTALRPHDGSPEGAHRSLESIVRPEGVYSAAPARGLTKLMNIPPPMTSGAAVLPTRPCHCLSLALSVYLISLVYTVYPDHNRERFSASSSWPHRYGHDRHIIFRHRLPLLYLMSFQQLLPKSKMIFIYSEGVRSLFFSQLTYPILNKTEATSITSRQIC